MDQDRFDIDCAGNSILADTCISGHVKSDKMLCLDGLVLGNVECADRVVINRTGRVDGEVRCGELYLNGSVTGNVLVRGKTVLGASAVIGGGLTTAVLEITPGARIDKGLKLKNASK